RRECSCRRRSAYSLAVCQPGKRAGPRSSRRCDRCEGGEQFGHSHGKSHGAKLLTSICAKRGGLSEIGRLTNLVEQQYQAAMHHKRLRGTVTSPSACPSETVNSELGWQSRVLPEWLGTQPPAPRGQSRLPTLPTSRGMAELAVSTFRMQKELAEA